MSEDLIGGLVALSFVPVLAVIASVYSLTEQWLDVKKQENELMLRIATELEKNEERS